jgi:hypothetical protein
MTNSRACENLDLVFYLILTCINPNRFSFQNQTKNQFKNRMRVQKPPNIGVICINAYTYLITNVGHIWFLDQVPILKLNLLGIYRDANVI